MSSIAIPHNGLDLEKAVVSPYLMFLQLARTYDIHELIILGCLLCACKDGPWGKSIIPKSNLHHFVDEAVGQRGRRQALRALKYIEERASSIMEVFVHLYLGLPNHLGGLGLKGGQFNYEVELNSESKRALAQKYCYLDYCFPNERIAYEYQGKTHNNSIDFDSSRTLALTQMGYMVVTITKSQLYNPEKRAQLFDLVHNLHGIKKRIRTDKYELGLQRIDELLPRNNEKKETANLADSSSIGKQSRYYVN